MYHHVRIDTPIPVTRYNLSLEEVEHIIYHGQCEQHAGRAINMIDASHNRLWEKGGLSLGDVFSRR